jgi:hypothetical protein
MGAVRGQFQWPDICRTSFLNIRFSVISPLFFCFTRCTLPILHPACVLQALCLLILATRLAHHMECCVCVYRNRYWLSSTTGWCYLNFYVLIISDCINKNFCLVFLTFLYFIEKYIVSIYLQRTFNVLESKRDSNK